MGKGRKHHLFIFFDLGGMGCICIILLYHTHTIIIHLTTLLRPNIRFFFFFFFSVLLNPLPNPPNLLCYSSSPVLSLLGTLGLWS